MRWCCRQDKHTLSQVADTNAQADLHSAGWSDTVQLYSVYIVLSSLTENCSNSRRLQWIREMTHQEKKSQQKLKSLPQRDPHLHCPSGFLIPYSDAATATAQRRKVDVAVSSCIWIISTSLSSHSGNGSLTSVRIFISWSSSSSCKLRSQDIQYICVLQYMPVPGVQTEM